MKVLTPTGHTLKKIKGARHKPPRRESKMQPSNYFATYNMDFSKSLDTQQQCVDFIWGLQFSGRAFHLDDDPTDIGIFTKEEAEQLVVRQGEIFIVLEDPYDIAIDAHDNFVGAN